jgi:Holliday junction DNA helicase RuvA
MSALAFVEGELVQRAETHVVLNCGGIGVRIVVPASTLQRLPEVGQRVRLWTVAELYYGPGGHGELKLYGFGSEAESRVFELLCNVSGVGTKTALSILSAISLAELRRCILNRDIATLQQLPGVGRKTAERLVVELRERMGQLEIEEFSAVPLAVRQEALRALMALGYTRGESERALQEVVAQVGQDATAEALIKAALRFLQG